MDNNSNESEAQQIQMSESQNTQQLLDNIPFNSSNIDSQDLNISELNILAEEEDVDVDVEDENDSQPQETSPINNNNNRNQNQNPNENVSEVDDRKHEENEEEDEDEEHMNMGEVKEKISEDLFLLQIAFINEKLSPEILEYDAEIVENIKQHIKRREEKIDSLTDEIQNFSQSGGNSTDNSLNMNRNLLPSIAIWWATELERTKFLLHGYLRARIWKVQKYAMHILSNEEVYNKLSTFEQKFVASYSDLTEKHMKQTFLDDLPKRYSSLTEPHMIVEPDLDVFKIMRVNESIGQFMISGGDTAINLAQGDILVCQIQ